MLTQQDIIAALKQGKPAPVYLLAGDEPLFIDQIASIRKQLIKGKLTNLQKGKVSAHYRVVTAPQKKK